MGLVGVNNRVPERSSQAFSNHSKLVGSRYSCGFPMAETEQPAKPFTALNGAL